MKFKLFLATLAFFAGSAQANSISTTVLVDNNPITDSVQYVNFYVSNAGDFDIYAQSTSYPSLNDPYILLFSGITPTLDTYLTGNNDANWFTYNSKITNYELGIGNYVLAVSNYLLTKEEAVSRNNPGVTDKTEGYVKVTIEADNGTARFGSNNPSAVPVPAAAWLFGSALLGFAGFRRKSV